MGQRCCCESEAVTTKEFVSSCSSLASANAERRQDQDLNWTANVVEETSDPHGRRLFSVPTTYFQADEENMVDAQSSIHRSPDRNEQHPLRTVIPNLHSCALFYQAELFDFISNPWPTRNALRMDLHCRMPKKRDVVVCICHSWLYQGHPDPMGERTNRIRNLLSELPPIAKDEVGEYLVYMDYLSTYWQPWTSHAVEEESFAEALRTLPYIHIFSNVVIHLDPHNDAESRHPQEGRRYTISCEQLDLLDVRQSGDQIQVCGLRNRNRDAGAGILDLVVAIDGIAVSSTAELKARRANLSGDKLVQMVSAPFGLRHTTPLETRGWEFLLRFYSVIKVALSHGLQENIFSDSPTLQQSIVLEGAEIRRAAVGGMDALKPIFDRFLQQLDSKDFSLPWEDAAAADRYRATVVQSTRQVLAEFLESWEDFADERPVCCSRSTLRASGLFAIDVMKLLETEYP